MPSSSAEAAGTAPSLASARSSEKTAMPSAASGTYRALISPCISRPHMTEPIPTPIENAARNSVTTPLPAPSVSFAKLGSCDRNTAPTSQNHDAPRIASFTSRRS